MADKTIPALKILRGNVGINTATPAFKIDVDGSAVFRGAAGWAGSDNQACAIYLNTAGRGVMGNFANYARNLIKANSQYVEVGQNSTLVYGIKFRVGSNAANGFIFESNISGSMTTLMNIRGNTGNVGIGTNSPATKLDVYSSSAALRISASGGTSPQLELSSVGAVNWKLRANINSSDFRITKDSSDYLTILSGGSVGIGTVSPVSLLHVAGNAEIGDTTQQSTVLTIKAQNTAGAPAATTQIRMKGYEGRGIGTFYEDSSYSGKEWFCGMNYSAAFGYWNVGYDASGGQAEYNANTLFRVKSTGRVEMLNYGSGTFTGTPTYKLAVDSSGNIIETAIGAGQVDGSGTANYVAKWTDGDTIGNSSIFDNGSVGIGTNNPSCLLQLGTTGVQGGASLAIRRNGDSINFGHNNQAGYGSVIGCSSHNGQPHIGFMCEAGTNNNTFRTRGLKGNVIYTNTSGTLYFAQVTNANADNQSLTNRVAIESDGDAYFFGGNWFCNTNNSTNVTNGGLYINRGGGLYAYALATARSGTGLGGVDFWDYHGVGLVFGPDSSTKVLTVKSNIGIGTTDPGYKLEVKASVTGNWLARIYNTATSGNSGGLLVRMDEPGSTGSALGVYANGGYKFKVEPDGEVQILSGAAYTTHLNYQNLGINYITMANNGATYFRGSSNSITTMTVKGDGKVGILDSSPQTTLAVNGEASFGDGSRLSLIGLSIASSAASPNIKIRTKIPFALGGADFTVNIKGFIYGLTETANLTVCWHYYNSTFYNATCSSAGSWAPTIQLSAEDWDSSGTKKVCICLSTPGYWVKAYVESMFSHSYNDQYTDGWTWVDGTASGTGNDLASLSYRSDFGNNFKMLSNGCVGIGGGILTNAKLTVNGGLAVGDATYQSNMNNGAADFSVDCNGTSMISWVSNYLQVGGTGQNWSMKMYNGLLQTYSNDLTIIGGGTGTSYKLHLGTNGQTQTITCNNGSVGINTTSPGYKLDVYGGDARIGTNLRLGNGSAAGNSTNPAITSSGVTTAGVYFENSGVGFGAGSGSKYLFLSSAGNASLGGNGFFKQLGDRPYGTDNLNDYYRSNDEASFCQFYRYDATHGHWANSSGTLTTNAPSTLTQTTSQIYSYGSLLTLRSLNSFRGQFYFAHSASEFYWRSGWGTNGDQNWTRIVGDRNIQSVIHNVGHISTKAGNNLTVGGSITVQPGSGDGILFLKNSAASQILRLDQNSIRTTTNSQIVLFTNGNSNQLYLSSGGNVGIGTNSPAKKLHVAGSTLITNNNYHYGYTSGGAQATLIGITDSNNCIVGQNNANIANTYIYGGTGDINLNPVGDVKVNNADLFVDGNVGIASASPAATLDVKQGTANNNNKLMKVADDVLSVYKVTGLSNHTVTLTCGSYFQAEVVITANQTNGGTYNNLYIRGIWSNNHHSHHWDEIENIGSLTGSSFSIAVSANDVSNSGKLVITHTYSSGSFSQMVVRVTDLYGTAHSYSIT